MLLKVVCFPVIRIEIHRQARAVFARYRRLLGEHEFVSAVDFALVKALRNFQPERGRFAPYAWLYVKSEVRDLVARELRWQRFVAQDVEAVERCASRSDTEIEVLRDELIEVLGETTYSAWIERTASGASWGSLARRLNLPQRKLRSRVEAASRRIGRRYGYAVVAERRGPSRQSRRRPC
jgi:hypothetical protein